MTNTNAKIGLFFGSFNPVHVGHLALANYIAENYDLEEIWFVVSPQNPFKDSSELVDAIHRVNMLKNSVKHYQRLRVCDIELNLPTPSYSYATLQALSELHPHYNFTIIIGSDNLPYLNRWMKAEEIIAKYDFMVYPRPGYKINKTDLYKSTHVIQAPVFDIDSTSIRKGIKQGKNYCFLIPREAHDYIVNNNLYK